MKIEIGEYVRINGVIGKVEQIGNTLFWIEDGSSYSLTDKKIKHSKDIIDLIEIGDILEIELSDDFVAGFVKKREDKKILIQIENDYRKKTLQRDINNGIIAKILTILTKEQYTQNCYKIDIN